MTILSLKTGPGAKSTIICDNCGQEEERLTCTIKKSKLHFCDMECKIEYQTNKKRGSYIKPPNDLTYRQDRGKERRDVKLKIQQQVPKRCISCGRIYDGPLGNFSKSRDKSIPEPGQCGCINRAKYREEDYNQQDHIGGAYA